MKYYAHYVPGRLRIQSPAINENSGKADEFRQFVNGLSGILSVAIHTVTGSARIHFDEKKINCEQLLCSLENNGYFHISEAETLDDFLEKATEKVLEVGEKVLTDSIEGGE